MHNLTARVRLSKLLSSRHLEDMWKSRELGSPPECTAVAAIRLRMRMRILTRPENSLANLTEGCFGYFLFFFARGMGRGSSRRREWGGGGGFFNGNPRRVVEGGWEGVCGEFGRGVGGLNISFQGRNSHQGILLRDGGFSTEA